MTFLMTRLLTEMIAPFPVSIFLMVMSLLCLIAKRTRLGTGLLFAALVFQLFFGYGVFVRGHIAAREALYPALRDDGSERLSNHSIRHIVVLGSGHVSDDRLPANSQIGGSSLYRLVEGIRLRRYWPEAKLILTGGIGYDPVANALVVEKVAEILGVAKNDLIVEDRPRDTLQEAQLLAPLLGGQPFLLVTSALHMPRAMEIFRRQGMHPLPAPTDYILKREKVLSAGSYLPNPGNMELSRRLLYELLAEKWLAMK